MECAGVYRLFFDPGEVTEIRGLGLNGKSSHWTGFASGKNAVVSGYFDNEEDFGRCAEALDKAGAAGVYFTVNPCDPSLLARAANRLVAFPKHSTTDREIKCIRWLLIDLDPVRWPGISSSKKELHAAADLAKQIAFWLVEDMGFPIPIKACSGNGYHFCVRLDDLPRTDENVQMVKASLEAIKVKFISDKVDIDQTVFNPARIWKVYGTHARKGDSISDRPHRRSYLFKDNPEFLKEVPLWRPK